MKYAGWPLDDAAEGGGWVNAIELAAGRYPRTWSLVIKNAFARFPAAGRLYLTARELPGADVFRPARVVPLARPAHDALVQGRPTPLMRLDLAADEQRREAGEQMDRLRPAALPSTATRVPLSDALAELRGALGIPVPPSQQGDALLAEGVPDDAGSGGHIGGAGAGPLG